MKCVNRFIISENVAWHIIIIIITTTRVILNSLPLLSKTLNILEGIEPPLYLGFSISKILTLMIEYLNKTNFYLKAFIRVYTLRFYSVHE